MRETMGISRVIRVVWRGIGPKMRDGLVLRILRTPDIPGVAKLALSVIQASPSYEGTVTLLSTPKIICHVL